MTVLSWLSQHVLAIRVHCSSYFQQQYDKAETCYCTSLLTGTHALSVDEKISRYQYTCSSPCGPSIWVCFFLIAFCVVAYYQQPIFWQEMWLCSLVSRDRQSKKDEGSHCCKANIWTTCIRTFKSVRDDSISTTFIFNSRVYDDITADIAIHRFIAVVNIDDSFYWGEDCCGWENTCKRNSIEWQVQWGVVFGRNDLKALILEGCQVFGYSVLIFHQTWQNVAFC